MFGNHFLCGIFKTLEQSLDIGKPNPINTVQRILSGKNYISLELLSGKNAAANIGLGILLEHSFFVNPQNHVLVRSFKALHIVAVHFRVHIVQSVVTLTDVHDGGGVLHACIVT